MGLPRGRPQINAHRSFKDDAGRDADLQERISKALKAEGFRFVGPTTVYAFMQSTGMVNDHLVTCHRHAAVRRAAAAFQGARVSARA